MHSVAIAIMAKAPAPEGVKTRLAPVLGPEQRLALARALLCDRADQLKRLPGVDGFHAFTPDDARAELEAMLPEGTGLIAQRGEGLGERLHHASSTLFERGYTRVLLIDADSALVPDASLLEAAAALDEVDLVLGPSWDGGYYLIGMRQPRPELFRDIAFSTPAVLASTLRKAEGLSVHVLPSSYDVDEPRDLARLVADLSQGSAYRHDLPRRTAALAPTLATRVAPAGDPDGAPWTTLARRDVYRNPWIKIDERIVRLGADKLTLYGVVDAGPCVGVLPRRADGQVLLVRQYRYVAGRYTWEIPTGGCARGEAPPDAAQRELEEETGHRAERLEALSSFHTSKSVMDEVAHLFIGHGVRPGPGAESDPTEDIETRFFPLDAVLDMIDSGEIVDSMTIVAVLTAMRRSA